MYAATCPYFGCAIEDAEESHDIDNPYLSEMFSELGNETRVYLLDITLSFCTDPAFPHSPVLVAVRTFDAVVLRWRSFETLLWPVERFVLQRYPDKNNKLQWCTLLDDNISDLVDFEVQPGRRYAYRVQTISRLNVTSAYEYQSAELHGGTCGNSSVNRASSALLGSLETFNAEGTHSLGLIFACFLTVYGLVRASVLSVQGTQSRSHRLKRIRMSMSEEMAAVISTPTGQDRSVVSRRSLTSTSSSSSSVDIDPSLREGTPDDIFPTVTARVSNCSLARSSMGGTIQRQQLSQSPFRHSFQSISRRIGPIDKKTAACEHCGKRFGFFRKRRLCDICHSVSLCRKCGYPASLDNIRTDLQLALADNTRATMRCRGPSRRRSCFRQHQQKHLKIRSICRNCCDDMYRYTTNDVRTQNPSKNDSVQSE
ncbi:hypothetical protein PsorP6_006875 [Peronosclerospora sorghi]|uniref:Uncharacterized protein n=1 Tax=Peronosclerospora sorghi TaxID=230839 RepID=A0ACC0WCH2_9STRA|nr:hypothetical protein PsorP6_006875 [Peronosclerospora sorghi]